jgi:hypothetical protein
VEQCAGPPRNRRIHRCRDRVSEVESLGCSVPRRNDRLLLRVAVRNSCQGHRDIIGIGLPTELSKEPLGMNEDIAGLDEKPGSSISRTPGRSGPMNRAQLLKNVLRPPKV